ncbi:MAG TPA: FtsX-like permease family protein [Bryobacteraceae bacterium]|nr:FtsX-like permease family protein [Bryobacteraceae bacterium]
MILLRLISWPYVRKHLLRSVLTTAGIVLGVALLVGMQTANQSVLQSFNRTVDRIAGKTQLQVTAGDSGFTEDVLERVEAVPGVKAAAPAIEASVDTNLHGQGKLLILAVDMTGDRSLRDYDFENGDEDVIDDPLVFLAQPDSLIITREFADRNSLSNGSKLAFDTMEGRKQFTVRGILKAGGLAAAFGGNLGIMDIYAAQKVFGRGRRFDRIDVGLDPSVSIEQGEAVLRKALGPGLTVEPPSGRGRQFESLIGVYTAATGISSLFALFIGMFIIYNSFSIAVTQRRSEIGILRALGATRRQIRTLFLGESAVAGLIGSSIGAFVGLALARNLTATTGRLMDQLFGVPNSTDQVLVDPNLVVGAIALGVVMSMIAAFIPARNAARVEPIQALQKGRYQVLGAGESRTRRITALIATGIALACLPFSQYHTALFGGFILTALACLLLTPFLSLEMAKLLRRPLKSLRPIEGSLAADSLIQAPRRTSATVAALMLSLALVIGQGGMARSSVESLRDWMEGTLNPDLFINASANLASTEFRFPAGMESELRAIPGVDEVQPVRTLRKEFRGKPVMIVALDMTSVAKRVRRHVVEGDDATMNRLAAEGKGVIIAENLAILENIHLGDTINVPVNSGSLPLPVAGVIRDYSNQLGAIFLDRAIYARTFQDDTVNIFRVYLKPGFAPEDVRRTVNERLGDHRRLFIMLNAEIKDYIMKVADAWLGMTYVQVVVAMVVALLGIVNTLTVSISDRRRELGVLRAVGGLRAQIRGTIWLEAISIGTIGLVLGIAAGCLFLYYDLQALKHGFGGMPLAYEFPTGIAVVLVPVILGAAVASAIVPAETAVRSSLVEALEYE